MSEAQTITTNWVMPPPGVVEVGGKFYNSEHSQLFKNFDGLCVDVNTNGATLHERITQPIMRPAYDSLQSSGNFLGSSGASPAMVKVGEKVLSERNIYVLNLPNASQISIGSRQTGRAMQVGITNVDGQSVALIDCGKRYLVPILKTNVSPQ